MNPTSNHEDSGLIPGLAQQAKDLVLLWAVVEAEDETQIPCCCDCGVGQQLQLPTLSWELPHAEGAALKRHKKKKEHAYTYVPLTLTYVIIFFKTDGAP